jgi:hypothetical protein
VAACVLGGAHVVRVHDVREMAQVARVCDAILEAGGSRAAAAAVGAASPSREPAGRAPGGRA